MRISDWSSDVCSSDLKEARSRLALAAQSSRSTTSPELQRALGSGPINCTFEASKWRRYWVRVGAAGSIATRKAARTQDRSHFGVPSGFDRFCPGRRRQVWKYRHIPAPCLLALSKIASNLDRAINGS